MTPSAFLGFTVAAVAIGLLVADARMWTWRQVAVFALTLIAGVAILSLLDLTR